MGWATDLQDASFRGVRFECTSTNDAVSKALAIKQAPYSNDASIEDMGNNPRDISISALYTGEDYKTWLDALEAALLATGSGELVHPVFGIQHVYVVDYSIDHDAENFDSCKISIKFKKVKDKKRDLFIPVTVPAKIATLDIIATPASALDRYLKKLELLDQNKFFNTINDIRNKINQFRDNLGLIKTSINTALSPAKFIVGLIDDVTLLVTFNSDLSAISKWRDLLHRVQRFENIFQESGVSNNSTEIMQLWRATQIAISISVTQAIVSQARKEITEATEMSLTPIDLAIIRQKNRQDLQKVIDTERLELSLLLENVTQIQIYKRVADQIHLQIQELIELRPPITTIQILVPCTLHWLAHQFYGDMNRAAEIRRLNPDLENPALLLTGMELTVYAR